MNKCAIKTYVYFFAIILFSFSAVQMRSELAIPPFGDAYCSYVKQLENGDVDIDYLDFRNSYLESEQFILSVNELYQQKDSLMKMLVIEMDNANPSGMINITEQLLGMDYTDMSTHNIQRQAYTLMGDSINAKKHEMILLGLLRSIIDNGNGQSCETAWPINQLSEAYFIIQLFGAQIIPSDDIVETNSVCEPMLIEVKEQQEKIYFNTEKMQKGLAKISD